MTANPRDAQSYGRDAETFGEAEWFEYPATWERAYKVARGTRRYFAQYALMEFLRQRHGIQSLTWLHLASVDHQTKRRLESGEPWVPASPRPSPTDPGRTQRRAAAWNTMRQQMGPAFEILHQAILGAKFVGAYQGEPDLFCWTSRGWFFAEAKTLGERFLPSQNKWWSIAGNLSGVNCQIFGCRVVAEGGRPSNQPPHTNRWNQLMKVMHVRDNSVLGTADDFVKKVLVNRDDA